MSPSPSQVVVAFDFSVSGRVALERAIALATRAPFHVLHFVCALEAHTPIPSIPAPTGVDYDYAETVQQAITAEVEAILGTSEVPSRVHFAVHARIGDPATEILAVARDVGADLILVGSRGSTGLTRLVLGSVSEKVARTAGCTVEIVRPKIYKHVDLSAVETIEPHHTYHPPHRYTYEDKRLNTRPREWPLY